MEGEPTSKKWHVNYSLDSIKRSLTGLEEYITKIESTFTEDYGTPLPIPQDIYVKAPILTPSTTFYYSSSRSDPNQYYSDWQKIAEKAKEENDRQLELSKSKHVENMPLIENNRKIIERITAIMYHIGISTKIDVRDPKSRAAVPKMITSDAGFITDLRRHISISDKHSYDISQHASNLCKISQFEQNQRKLEAEENVKIKHKERLQTSLLKFAKLQVKYSPNKSINISPQDIMVEIIRNITTYNLDDTNIRDKLNKFLDDDYGIIYESGCSNDDYDIIRIKQCINLMTDIVQKQIFLEEIDVVTEYYRLHKNV